MFVTLAVPSGRNDTGVGQGGLTPPPRVKRSLGEGIDSGDAVDGGDRGCGLE